jgi:hypothetical protein
LKNRIEIEQELILETDSDEAISTDNESEHNEHTMAVEITLVKTATSTEFWLCQSFHWRSQCTDEDTRGTPYEHGFFTDYSLFSLLLGCDPAVDEANKCYNQYLSH